MANKYNGEWYADSSEIPKNVDTRQNKIWLSADSPEFEWKSKDEYDWQEWTLYVISIRNTEYTEPCELKFQVEPGKLFTLGTFSSCQKDVFRPYECMKFDQTVTFYLSGAGPLQIYALEKEKQTWFWQDAKKFIDQYLWKKNFTTSSSKKIQ